MIISANIATRGNRPEQLKKTIAGLMDQCDKVRVYNNATAPVDYADNAKFYWLQFLSEPEYYLCCDDDLIFEPNYVEKLKYWIDMYKSIISFHGRILKDPVTSYYGNKHRVYDFRAGQMASHNVHVVGTGVMGFRTDYFCPTELYKSPDKRMSDLVFSLEAIKNKKTLICAEHEAQWIIQQPVEDSIQKTESAGKQTRQIEIANEILRLSHG